ncbi:MAG: hypothetical protein EB126_02440, partial [Synechococcaceae bacterium WBB_10_009]|nr:hypothetical protein [Synechococcaceae bacterium WBB_10_009]
MGQAGRLQHLGLLVADRLAHEDEPWRCCVRGQYGPGGTSLLQAWRPPSAGPTGNAALDAQELDDATVEKWFHGRKGKVVGCQYRYLVNYVKDTLTDPKTLFPAYDEKAGYRIAGFVWFQGYNDLG